MNKLILKLQGKKAEMYTDKVVWILGCIVVGVGLFLGINALAEGTVMDGITQAIEDLFDAIPDVGATEPADPQG